MRGAIFLDELQNGSAKEPGGSPSRATISPLVALNREIAACASLDHPSLIALINRALDTPHVDLRPFLNLSPRQVAGLVRTREWITLLDSMAGLAVLDPHDRYTKSQWRALGYFRRDVQNGSGPQKNKKTALDAAEVIEVEAEA